MHTLSALTHAAALSWHSDWIADGANELMVTTAGPSHYYLNSVGFYLSEAGDRSGFAQRLFLLFLLARMQSATVASVIGRSSKKCC